MKQIKINTEIKINLLKGQTQIKFKLDHLVSLEMTIALVILKEGLVNSIGLKFDNFLLILKPSQDNYSYFESLELKSSIFKGKISNVSIEYILYFILKYYRDGIADTEHVDVDFINSIGNELTLTINCDDYQEHTNDEIRRLLE